MKPAPEFETVIGLEVHAQLLTKTKLFCADITDFGQPPNTAVSVISLGHPGTLPRMNKKAIELAIRIGLATECEIVRQNYFARKNYFYPDLPKGYQISQHTTPICKNGRLQIHTSEGEKHIRINRIHIEEDAGKSIHDEDSMFSNIDYNRAGVPLVEIVTEPDLSSAEEAAAYLTKLQKLVRHLDVCDGNMEEGSFRCDVNISIRRKGDSTLGTKVEIKNLNSVRFMKRAIAYETGLMARQIQQGEAVIQQTKGFDDKTGSTYTIRIKEDEDDYRYFPEPDLPPFIISEELIRQVREQLPPDADRIREQLHTFGLSATDVQIIADDADFFEFFMEATAHTKNYRAAANWITGPIRNHLNESDVTFDALRVTPQQIAEIIGLIDAGVISYGIALNQVFPALVTNPALDVQAYIKEARLGFENEEETNQYIQQALAKHADKIEAYQKGKKGLISVFVGEVMKLSGGKADAKKVTEKITETLKK